MILISLKYSKVQAYETTKTKQKKKSNNKKQNKKKLLQSCQEEYLQRERPSSGFDCHHGVFNW